MAKPFQFRLRTLLLAVVAVALVALPLGWYSSRTVPPQIVRVSGTVTLDGQPLAGAIVIFSSIDPGGRTALGVTGSTGWFSTDTHIGGSKLVLGAFPGFYRVTLKESGQVGLWCPPVAESAKPPTDVPKKYADVDTSGLSVEVTVGGPNVFAFELNRLPEN